MSDYYAVRFVFEVKASSLEEAEEIAYTDMVDAPETYTEVQTERLIPLGPNGVDA